LKISSEISLGKLGREFNKFGKRGQIRLVTMVQIRPFTPDDQDAARELILEGLKGHFGYIDYTLNPDLDDISGYYLKKGNTFLVAEIDERLVGTGALVVETAGIGRIVRMSVKKDHRRRGIGRALVKYLLRIAHQRGFHQTLVETNHDWYDAIALYQSHGFTEYHRDEESVHMRIQIK